MVRRAISELRTVRQLGGISQRALGRAVGCSQSEINRIEQFDFLNVPLPRLCEIAAVLGVELSLGIHPAGEPIRDKAHQALLGRLRALLGPPYEMRREVPLPLPGDDRSWDAILRCGGIRIGVEAETRIRDIQALVRRIRGRERDGGVDAILIVLSDTAHNRRMVVQLREALGDDYSTPRIAILAALRAGRPLVNSGVVLL